MRTRAGWVSSLCLLAGTLLAVPLSAQDNKGLPDAVVRGLNAGKVRPEHFSAWVQEIGKETPLVAFNGDVPRNPASTMKLVTTFIGLEALGPTYTWKTQVYAKAPPKGGVLDGDLYIKGYGDPFMVLERFWLLLREIRLQGVREIRGDLVIDDSYFAVGDVDPGDFDGRPFNPYNLVPDAFLVNFQAVNFIFRPDAAHGRVELLADPLPANLKLRNEIQLVDGSCGGPRNRIAFTVESAASETVTFSGRFARSCSEYRVTRSMLKPATYAYGVFRTLWEETGGSLRGGLRLGTVPAGATTIATAESPPLGEVIRSINKFSNNVMARTLLLTLGAERFGAPGTVDKGDRAAADFLKNRGLGFPELKIENGAGLSRESRVSVRSLVRLLIAADQSAYRPEYVASLGLAGLDGTVRRRFRNEDFAGSMHLKTGTLNDVHAIAGYVDAQSGRRFAVAIIQNGGGWVEEAQSALLRWTWKQ